MKVFLKGIKRPRGSAVEVDLDSIIAAGVAPAYEYIVTTPQASIDTFVDDGGDGVGSALLQTYSLMEISILSRTSHAVANSTLKLICNNDSGDHYDNQVVTGHGGGGSAVQESGVDGWEFITRGNSSFAGYPGVVRLSIPSYAKTNFKKVAVVLVGATSDDVESWVRAQAMGWRDYSAINRVKLTAGSGSNFLAGTILRIDYS